MTTLLTTRLTSVDRSETQYYLGYTKGVTPSKEVKALFDECESLILKAQDLKAVYDTYDIKADGDELNLGFAEIHSHSLALNLKGCSRIVLFAATAGAGVDRLIVKYSRISPSKAAVLQAMGAALIESWCDEICARLKEKYNTNTSRFSCGFGDCDITLQRDIFYALSVTKRLGITLSDDCFMTPTKSVTAMVGIKDL
ncbi:MAG: vitamin B12 dependent-methionine synthase activation domain-containing protein [Candidatus Coproplasma sp.]